MQHIIDLRIVSRIDGEGRAFRVEKLVDNYVDDREVWVDIGCTRGYSTEKAAKSFAEDYAKGDCVTASANSAKLAEANGSNHRQGGRGVITFKVPFPDMKNLSSNRRGHWSKFSAPKKSARALGYGLALEAKGRETFSKGVKVELHFFQPDYRKRDDDNMIAALKPTRDGIADAIKVDDGHWKTSPFFPEKRVKGGCVVVKISNPDAS